MNYILNSLEEIQKVYTPSIEELQESFLPCLPEFRLSKKVILESMRFRIKLSDSKGEEGFSSELSTEAILTGIKFNLISKNNLIYNFDYHNLLKNIDLDVFSTELDKLISNQESDFIVRIKEELDNNNNHIKFVKKLREDKNSLVKSWKNLKFVLENANDFDKIIIDKYRISFRRVYDFLKREHEKDTEPVVIFRFNDFWENDYKNDGESPWNSPFLGFGKNKTINFETDNKSEISNPFPDIFKSIDTYNYFLEYNEKHILEPFIDYSYVFQRLLKERLIHKQKHFEFMDWLLQNKLISDNKHNEFKIERNFRTLAKSHSIQREQNFNIIFKL